MFLSRSRQALACLLASCALFATGRASADARQCIAQNNDGAQLRDDHHLLAARQAYRACLAEPKCPAMVRAECDAALADIKSVIPTLLVAVVDGQGHDLPGATLQVDGKPIEMNGSTLEIDPGEHELVASSGALSSRRHVLALESDVNRRVEIVLQAAAVKVLPPPSPEPAARSYWPAYALGGVAALGAASWGYFALSGSADKDRLNECKPYCTTGEVQHVRNEYLAADISMGVSLVALAGATYWLLAAPKSKPADSTFSVTVTARPDVAGLSVRWVE